MPLTIPPELKKITPFVRRAEELDRDRSNPESRLVAYYCRQYAVSVGIPLATTAEGKKCLGNILGDLEAEKEPMSNFTRQESRFLCKKFADGIFNNADGEDRMGMATKNTARSFYAAATFYEILQQFYEDDEDLEEQEEEKKRIVYSKWKSTEIIKAIREGRKPTPGGFGEDLEEEDEQETEREENEEEVVVTYASEADPLPPPLQPASQQIVPETVVADDDEQSEQGTEVGLFGPPPAYPEEISAPEEVFIPSPSSPQATASRPPIKPVTQAPSKPSSGLFGMGRKKTPPSKVSKAALADAIELTKFALSALQNKDAETGASRLKEALAALGH